MKRFVAGCLFLGATALAAPAGAQVQVIGGGLGQQCFELASIARDGASHGDDVCTKALRHGRLDRRSRAATFVNRGVLRMRATRYEQALNDFDRAIRLKPELGEAHLNAGATHIYRQDFGAAIAELNVAIEKESRDLHAAYYNRAIARERSGDVTGAYYDFQMALELQPDWDLALQQLERFSVEEAPVNGDDALVDAA